MRRNSHTQHLSDNSEQGASILETVLIIACIAILSLTPLRAAGMRIKCIFNFTADQMQTQASAGIPLSQAPACSADGSYGTGAGNNGGTGASSSGGGG